MDVVIKLSDFHVPYQDNRAINTALSLVKHIQPMILVLDEVLDFYTLSKYNKDPARIIDLQKDLDKSFEILYNIRKAVPNTRIVMVESNHDKRLMKYKFSKAPELSYLRNLTFEKLMRLAEVDIEYKPFFIFRNILFKHGNIVRQDSSYTAKAEMVKEGMSGASGHCFSADTEILTKDGWKLYKNLDLDKDCVGTRNKKTGVFEWNKINDLYIYDNYKELYHITGQTVDLMVTDKHGMLYRNRLGFQGECDADNLPGEFYLYNSCKLSKETDFKNLNKVKEAYLRLLINILADGCVEDNSIRWHLKKERKIKHLIELLETLDYVFSVHKQKTGNTKIRLSAKSSVDVIKSVTINKEMPHLFTKLGKHEAEIILNEYSITDGCKNSAAKNSYQLSSFKKEWLNILQTLFMKNGMRTVLNGNYLTVNTRSGIRLSRDRNVETVPYNGKVWCVNVGNGTLIVRRNGKVTVTLNSHRLGQYYKTLRGGKYVWLESGCLCKTTNVEYIDGTADWQQGLVMFMFKEGKRHFQPKVIPIIKGEILWGSKLFKGKP